jgi:hypothetical protein
MWKRFFIETKDVTTSSSMRGPIAGRTVCYVSPGPCAAFCERHLHSGRQMVWAPHSAQTQKARTPSFRIGHSGAQAKVIQSVTDQ